MIFPEVAASRTPTATQPATPSAATMGQRFARTSDDQGAAPEKNIRHSSAERNTRATSDRTADPTAPSLPSQAGITPKDEMEIETTESDYQDGSLDSAQTATPETATPPARRHPSPHPARTRSGQEPQRWKIPTGPDRTPSPASPPPREKLLEGPHPVDVPGPA